MYCKNQYVSVINTKDDNHTTSDDNVRDGYSDVGYKNQMFSFMDNMKSLRRITPIASSSRKTSPTDKRCQSSDEVKCDT